MPGLGLSIADLTVRRSGAPVAAPLSITRGIAGDSISSTTPNQSINLGDFYSYVWKAANPGLTLSVNAQASRTVGGAAANGDGADTGSPNGNTLLDNRATDIAFGPQLLTAMVGANDLGTFQVATYITRLIAWAGPIRSAGIKVAYSPPTPYRQTSPQPNYATYTARRMALFATSNVRDPAVWGQWADYYIPLGEHPDFLDSANDGALYGDGVHPSAPVATATTGQARLYAIYNAAMTTLLDASRVNSTAPYNAVWPTSETNLAAGTTIMRRVMISGIAHTGLATGVSVTGPAGTTVKLNGGTAGSSTTGIYNGDVIDIAIPLSASNDTAVSIDLTIGGETRTISYRTVAVVAPATYAHQGVQNIQPAAATHTFTGLAFDNIGVGLMAINSQNNAPTGVNVGGVAATRLLTRSADSVLSLWTLPITATGARNVVLTYSSSRGQTTMSWGVVKGADTTPMQVDPAADGTDGSDSPPFQSGALTVPASGIAVAFFCEYGGASITPAACNTGTTFVDEGSGTYQGETLGICIGKRTTSGTASFQFAFGPRPRAAAVFKAAGT